MSRRIAIVEDDPAIRANYAEALRKHGFDVSAYGARAEALAAMRARLPDLAVIDIGLGSDADAGFDLCRELRALSASLPIIFLTARDSDFDVVSGLRLGADDYLTKDVSLPHLLARLAAHGIVARRRRREELRAVVQRRGHGARRGEEAAFLARQERTLQLVHEAHPRPGQGQERQGDERELRAQTEREAPPYSFQR